MFYHGTTNKFGIKECLLSPSETHNLREEWRKKLADKVFFTSSLMSARMYAKKACAKYGGEPIVYGVLPVGEYYNTVNNEYVADKAIVIKTIT